jgi:hypothetical protein
MRPCAWRTVLRVALLTMMAPAEAVDEGSQASIGGGGAPLRADLRLGAVTLARHQLGVALALGCERIVCLAHALDDEISGLQSATEALGARFHVIDEPRALVGLVTAIDELIALGDGLLAWPPMAISLLEAGPAVLVQPVDRGMAAGFERLDLNHADAAIFRMPGRLVHRLAELPADCDGFSALQRIALQGGVPQRLVPAAALAEGQWTLVRSESEAHAVEALWIRLQTETGGGNNASLWVAQFAVRRLGPALLHAGSGHGVVAAAAAVTALLALGAGGIHWVVAGFILAAIAWLLLCAAGLMARIERATLYVPSHRVFRGRILGWVSDAILAVLMVQSVNGLPGQNLGERAFAPVVLLGLCRLIQQTLPKNRRRWLEDRGLLALLLAVCATAGVLGPGIDAITVLLLGAGLYGAGARAAEPEVD